MDRPPRAWHVFAVFLAAIASILATTWLAFGVLASWDPDVPHEVLLRSLSGMLAASLGASAGFLLTLAVALRPFDPAALRLTPGWETGGTLAVAVAGLLALGQALDSATFLAGLGDRGAMAEIRRLLEGAAGPELFAAVVVIGVIAPAVEETFFRGFMQPRLAAHWGARPAVLATSACFAALHVDTSGIHVALALALSVYLGFVAHLTGSTLPAIVCHIVNNTVFTLQTALGWTVTGRGLNAALAAACAVVFVGCVARLRRAAPEAPPA